MTRIIKVVLLAIFLLPVSPALAGLSLQSIYPNQGILGQDLEVEIKGAGFNVDTFVSMTMGVDEKSAIMGTFKADGPVLDVAFSDDTAYVVDEYGLKVVDVSSPDLPAVIGAVSTPGKAVGVTVNGTTVYVADDSAGLQVIDVSEPALPVIVGTKDFSGKAVGVAVSGTTVYVADDSAGLRVIDAADPASPIIKGTVETQGKAVAVAIDGTIAYVVDEYGLNIIDVGSSASPVMKGLLNTPGTALGVAVYGTEVFIADGSAGLQVVDVNDPENPHIQDSVKIPGKALGVAVDGQGTAYVAGDYGLHIIDTGTPGGSAVIGFVKTPAKALSVNVNENTAYVAAGLPGLQVIDVGDPRHPLVMGALEIPEPSWNITVKEGKAYIANEYGLHIVDVTDPEYPVIIADVKTPGLARAVAVAGDNAYVADHDGGLQVIDVSDAKSPAIAGSVNTPGLAYYVAVKDDTAYVADYTKGLQIIDVTDPGSPLIVGSVETSGFARGVAVDGQTVYVAGGSSLQVINVSDPDSPELIGAVETPGYARAVFVDGSMAYVSDSFGLQIIDVSDSKSPKHIGGVETSGSPLAVTVKDGVAYVADSASGVQIIDVSDPESPFIIRSLDTLEAARGVTADQDVVYIVDEDAGLAVIPLILPVKPVSVVNSSTLNVTLPSPSKPGNYTLRVFDAGGDWSEIPGIVNFSSLDFSALDPGLLELRTEHGEIPPTELEAGEEVTLHLIYMNPDGTLFNISNLTGEVEVQWMSGNPDVLSVNSLGVAQAKAQGQAMIFAKIPGCGKSFTFEVQDPGQPQPTKNSGNLIVVTGRSMEEEELGETFQGLANMAYETFYKRGLGHEDIHYINAYGQQTILDQEQIVDKVPGGAEDGGKTVEDAVTSWAAAQNNTGPLYVYLTGPGSNNQQLKITPESALTADQLDKALDQFQADTGRKVMVVVEASFSGDWKDSLAASKRVIITSTGDNWQYQSAMSLTNTFSDFLFQGFSRGKTIKMAYEFANEGVQATLAGKGSGQSPQYVSGDSMLWESYIGGPWVSAGFFVVFSDYTGKEDQYMQVVPEQGIQLSASLNVLNKDWVEVYALLTPPVPGGQGVEGFETPVLSQIKVPMDFQNETTGEDYFGTGHKVFGGTSEPLDIEGEWEIVYIVKDLNNELTAMGPVILDVTEDAAGSTLSMTQGWNLLALPVEPDEKSVDKLFADVKTQMASAWKWKNDKWSVYLPGVSIDEWFSYAQEKGFDTLSNLQIGEGFWVNSDQNQNLSLTGVPITQGQITLSPGWNLKGLLQDSAMYVQDLQDSNDAQVKSIWKWQKNKWEVYLPGEDDGGAAYADSKGFELLENIEPGEGFWANVE